MARTRQRLAIAKEKLEIIKGNERATTVFSPAKYPAPKTLDDFVPMYNSINPLSRIVHPDYDLDEEVEVRRSLCPVACFRRLMIVLCAADEYAWSQKTSGGFRLFAAPHTA